MMNASFCGNSAWVTPSFAPTEKHDFLVCWFQYGFACLEKDGHPLVKLQKSSVLNQSHSLVLCLACGCVHGLTAIQAWWLQCPWKGCRHIFDQCWILVQWFETETFPKKYLLILIYLGRWIIKIFLEATAEEADFSKMEVKISLQHFHLFWSFSYRSVR